MIEGMKELKAEKWIETVVINITLERRNGSKTNNINMTGITVLDVHE